jgi:hypothetical protein
MRKPRAIHGFRTSKDREEAEGTAEKVEVALRLTVSQSVCLGIEQPCEICDQILFPFGMLLSEICGLVSVGRPL